MLPEHLPSSLNLKLATLSTEDANNRYSALETDTGLHQRLPQDHAANLKYTLYRLGILLLLALMFIPIGFIVTSIVEEKAMDVLQIMAVFGVEAVRMIPLA